MSETVPKLQSEGAESREGLKSVYTALFIKDVSSLLGKFPPRHTKIYGHHSTIEYEPLSLDDVTVGAESRIRIIGRAQDEKGDALLVENRKSKNKYPHITVSCAVGTSSVYSNELIENAVASNSVEYFDVPVEVDVVEGFFDGKDDIITSQQ